MKSEIVEWIKQIHERPNVVALNVGLFESDSGYQAYLVGSNEYDPKDDDWACNEDFVPCNKYLNLQCDSSVNWQSIQSDVEDVIKELIASNSDTILNHVPNVTVGFDDADLVKVK